MRLASWVAMAACLAACGCQTDGTGIGSSIQSSVDSVGNKISSALQPNSAPKNAPPANPYSQAANTAWQSPPPGGQVNETLKSAQNDSVKSTQQLAQDAPGAVAGGAQSGPMPLAKIFDKHPFDSKADFKTAWPRVALTILKAPSNASANWSQAQYMHARIAPGCFELSAVVWESRTKSTQIAPFTSCFPDVDMQNYQGVALKGAENWVGQTGYFAAVDESTGNQRNDGPVPPDSPVPTGPKYQRFYGLTGFNSGTVTGGMFAHLLLQMGFDWSQARDRRVWISKIVPAE